MKTLSGEYDYLFKIIVTGDGAVGKTAITVRFSQGKFDSDYKMTIGVDFAIKMIDIDGKKIKLQIWDTGGQERFSYIRPLYYKGAMGNALIFDLTNRASFEHLDKWYNEVLSNCGEIPMILVGNKADLADRAVSKNEAQDWAASHGLQYYETSAKTGENVGDVFSDLANILVSGPVEEGVPGSTIVSTTPPKTISSPKPTTSFTSPPPKPTPSTFSKPKPQPQAPKYSSPAPPKPKPVSIGFSQQEPSFSAQESLTPKPHEKTTFPEYKSVKEPPSTPTQPQATPSQPSTTPSSDDTLDEALKLLNVEDTTQTVPSQEQPKPITSEPQPVEIPEVSEPVPIEEPEPIEIEEPEPVEIPEVSEPIPIEEPEPIELEEPEPITIEETEPVELEGPQPVLIEDSKISEPEAPQFKSPFGESISEAPQEEISIEPSEIDLEQPTEPAQTPVEELSPVDVLNEEEPIELPSPESILDESGGSEEPIDVLETQERKEESIFGISSTTKEKQEFAPFVSGSTESAEGSTTDQIPSSTGGSTSTDLFTALSQKSRRSQETRESRFTPFIPTAEGEYEDIELEVIMKDEEEIEAANTIKCPGCNREIPADWKFCTYCGTLLS
ncbi:MAG: GTP-binding protein [Candidatus Lokiarchaeota archaeon]|nr:GTP-binding protein [Candidatus Lokiarchaeota archaeon]